MENRGTIKMSEIENVSMSRFGMIKVIYIMEKDARFVLDLITKHKLGLIKIITSKLGQYHTNDVEDCFQDLFVLAFINRKKLYCHPNPVGWLFVTASNLAHDTFRKNQKDEQHTISFEDAIEISGTNETEKTLFEYAPEDEPEIIKERILEQLNYREKKLYQLKYIEKKNTKYLAQYFSTTEGCIRAWLSQMRKHIKKIIEKQTQ